MGFNYIPPGTFMMGSPEDERGRNDDEDRHQVTLTEGYFLAETEVTQGQWEAVGLPMPSTCGNHGIGPNYPVYCVPWNHLGGGGGFVHRLNLHLVITGQPGAGLFRLPTEAQWERAARGGTQTEFSFAVPENWDLFCGSFPEASPFMVWCGNDNNQVELVGSKQANQYGLHDMHGNLWEWVQDVYTDHLGHGPVTDPTGPETGFQRVLRGGLWDNHAMTCRSANRHAREAHLGSYSTGFRLARIVAAKEVFFDGFESGDTFSWSATVE